MTAIDVQCPSIACGYRFLAKRFLGGELKCPRCHLLVHVELPAPKWNGTKAETPIDKVVVDSLS